MAWSNWTISRKSIKTFYLSFKIQIKNSTRNSKKLLLFRLISVCLWFLPDIVMLLTSIIAFIALKKLTNVVIDHDAEEAEQRPTNSDSESIDENVYSPEQYILLKRTGKIHWLNKIEWTNIFFIFIYIYFLFLFLSLSAIFCAITTLLFAATLRPSVPSGIYFIVFLIVSTAWSLYKEIDRGFAILCRLMCVLLVIHISALLAYQTPWPQQYLDANNTIIR